MNQPQMLVSRQSMMQSGAMIGAPGYLAMLAGSIGLAVFAPLWVLLLVVLLLGGSAARLAPGSFRPLLRPRWLVLCAILVLPSVFLSGPADREILGIAYSVQGLETAFHALLRMVTIFIAVSIFTSSVEISTLAGIFEKLGLRGLGFSLGVAMNLLPNLQQSALTTWRVLYMRGGFRRRRWYGLSLMVITVITQALGRAEEIALAAESRAFTPERAAAYPLISGKYDGWLVAANVLAVAAAILFRFVI